MITIKSRFVYEVNELENFFGMLRLDVYITLMFFNGSNEEYNNVFLQFYELSQFVTECLVEALTREKIYFSDLDVSARDFYISAVPSSLKDTKKILLFKHLNKK